MNELSDIAKLAEEANKKAGYHTIEICGKQYRIKLMKSRAALAIALSIAKVIAPALAAWADSEKNKEFILPEEDNLYTEVALHLVNGLDKISVIDLVGHLTEGTECQGNIVDIDEDFKGNIGGLVKLVEFSLKENCGDFFITYLKEKGISLPSKQDAEKGEE